MASALAAPRTQAGWAALVIAVGAVCIAAVLLVMQLNPYLGDYGDDAEFLILGQGLARGDGYAWINSPEHPAHNRYPPGYPVYLSAVMLITGTQASAIDAVVPAKIATALTLLLALPPLWLLARRRLPVAWAAAAVALFALNPFALRFAAQVMSDVPYLPIGFAALALADWLADRETRKADRLRPGRIHAVSATSTLVRAWLGWVALGVLLAVGAYVRSVGMAAAAGVTLWILWGLRGRPWREARVRLLAPTVFVALMLPWWLRDAMLSGGWRYLEELLAARYADPGAGIVGGSDVLQRALGNAGFYVGKPADFGVLGVVAALLAAALIAGGYAAVARRGAGAAEWAVVLFAAAVLVWPIRTGRYLLPVIPLAGVYAIAGALAAGRALSARWTSSAATPEIAAGAPAPAGTDGRRNGYRRVVWPHLWWTRALSGGLLLFGTAEIAVAGRDAAANVRLVSSAGGPAGYYRDRPDWAHYLQAAAWLRGQTSPDDIAMARRHFALYVYSGRSTEKYRFDTSEEELAYLLSGMARKFVVDDAFDVLRGDFAPLIGALRARGGDLLLRFETREPAVRVWELVRPPSASSIK
jgi:hypothetical protein